MAGRHMQVHRRLLHIHRSALDDDWLGVDQRRWRRIANVYAAIHPRRQRAANAGVGIRGGGLRSHDGQGDQAAQQQA